MPDIRSKRADVNYLLTDQYKTADNLDARAQLHVQFGTNPFGWQRWLFDQLDLPPRARVIELGCGPGWLWVENAERIPADWDITLSDFSAGMVEAAQHRLGGSAHAFSYEVIDAQSIPRDDSSFDAVIANHMLYHVPNQRKALAEMRRILKPSGRLYTATNGANHLRELYDLEQRFDPSVNFWEGFSAARSFELDNGPALLGELFPHVALRRYRDSLHVSEVEPLVAYILSGPGKAQIDGEKRAKLRGFLQDEMDKKGAIDITKDSGVLISSFQPI